MSEHAVPEEDVQTPSASQSTTLDLIPRRGSSSLAWRWFGFEKADITQTTAICKLCKKAVAIKDCSTTNLFHHLRANHRKEYEEYEKFREPAAQDKPKPPKVPKTQTQQTLAESLNRKVPYDKKGSGWQEITNAVTNYIAQVLNTLDPRYKLPGRKYFSHTALYESCRQTLEHKLKDVAHFATTADLWSSRTSEPYLSMTAHFIDESWQLKSYCLQTSYIYLLFTLDTFVCVLKCSC